MGKVNIEDRPYVSIKYFLNTNGEQLPTKIRTSSKSKNLSPAQIQSLNKVNAKSPIITSEMIGDFEEYYSLLHSKNITEAERREAKLANYIKNVKNSKGELVSSRTARLYYDAYEYIRLNETEHVEAIIVESQAPNSQSENGNAPMDLDYIERINKLEEENQRLEEQNRLLIKNCKQSNALNVLTITRLADLDRQFCDALFAFTELGYKEGIGIMTNPPRAITKQEFSDCKTIQKVVLEKDKDIVRKLLEPVNKHLTTNTKNMEIE